MVVFTGQQTTQFRPKTFCYYIHLLGIILTEAIGQWLLFETHIQTPINN
jgi:hypothetical protein